MTLLRSDPCTEDNFELLWGDSSGDMVDTSRHQRFPTGGPQGGPFRRLTVHDGDDMGFSGERCEMGNNARKGYASADNPGGTFWPCVSGKTDTIKYWIRLPSNFPAGATRYQNVTQFKHACPCGDASSDQPEVSLQVKGGRWCLISNLGTSEQLWSATVTLGAWMPIEWHNLWHKDSGSIQVKIGSKLSPVFNRATLAHFKSTGGPMTGHMRCGIYHDKSIAPTYVDLANFTCER